MAIFTVHIKNNNTQSAVFIKDGFSWGAFIFGPLWLLSKKLWLAFFGFAALSILMNIAGMKFGLHPVALSGLSVLLGFFLGSEAADLQRLKMKRLKFEDAGVVQGQKLDDAECRFFDLYVGESFSPWSMAKEAR